MLYNTYPCETKDVKLNKNEESYEIPGYDGARISKYAPPGKLLCCQYEDAKTLTEMMERGCKLTGNGQCVGWRSSKSEYSWITYKEFIGRATHFGSGLLKFGIKLGQSSRISIYAQNSVEWLVAQYGCFYYLSPVVPLYDTIGPDARTFMINNAETQVVICDEEKKVKALLEKSEDTPVLKHIIHMKEISAETKELGKKKDIKLHLFKDIEELGKISEIPVEVVKPTDVAIICYTSGTTGNPKGVVLNHQNMIAGISGILTPLGDLIPNKNDVSISYLPLAHAYEQLLEVFIFLHGGSIGFFGGDISKLTDDIKVLQPTIFASVPRVLNKMYDKVESQIKMLKNSLKENGIVDKGHLPNGIKNSHNGEDTSYDPRICKAFSDSLGGKIRMIISGAAPIAENVLNFYRLALGCEVIEVYGQTETAGPCCVNVVTPDTVGSVGAPLLSNMIRLADVPELGYFKKNNIGEVCVKGLNVFDGYFKDPCKTEEAFGEDKWLLTGDIGQWQTNGTLKIVDRKKHIFKLAQGEYIMPEQIESIYLTSSYISQILIHGDSLQSFLVAIVIPEQSEVMTWCRENSITGTWNDICNNLAVKQHILEDMKRVAKMGGLLSFKQVKDIHLHPDPLTTEDGHLTPTQKTKRDIVKKFFMEEIQAMYSQSS